MQGFVPAGSPRVSLGLISILPPRMGARGLKERSLESPAPSWPLRHKSQADADTIAIMEAVCS